MSDDAVMVAVPLSALKYILYHADFPDVEPYSLWFNHEMKAALDLLRAVVRVNELTRREAAPDIEGRI